jgi:hypothetical protein
VELVPVVPVGLPVADVVEDDVVVVVELEVVEFPGGGGGGGDCPGPPGGVGPPPGATPPGPAGVTPQVGTRGQMVVVVFTTIVFVPFLWCPQCPPVPVTPKWRSSNNPFANAK